MADKGYIHFFLGLAILFAPVVFHGFRCGLFTGFSLKKVRWTLDQSILFQGGLALIAAFPLILAGFHAMAGHTLHPILDMLVMAMFSFEYHFWVYYVPVVVIFKLICLVFHSRRVSRSGP